MIFQKILVPLDGSELAERVVGPAFALAEAMAATVYLLTVVSKHPRRDPELMEKAVQTGTIEADLYLRSVKKHLLPALSPIETAVVPGKPENSIIQFAAENNIDLIILSTHGRSGLTRWSFGRVAEKVLRRSPCPTVILRSRQEIVPEQFRRILVPLDGSVLAERVLEPAMEMTAVLNLNLIVMRVVEKERFPGFGYDGSEAAREEDEAQAYLREIHDRLAAQGVSCQTAITFGAAADEIVDFAEAEDVDIIMLSSRGKAGFDAWMFGSVAEKVMQGAACATLVIRQEPFPASAA